MNDHGAAFWIFLCRFCAFCPFCLFWTCFCVYFPSSAPLRRQCPRSVASFPWPFLLCTSLHTIRLEGPVIQTCLNGVGLHTQGHRIVCAPSASSSFCASACSCASSRSFLSRYSSNVSRLTAAVENLASSHSLVWKLASTPSSPATLQRGQQSCTPCSSLLAEMVCQLGTCSCAWRWWLVRTGSHSGLLSQIPCILTHSICRFFVLRENSSAAFVSGHSCRHNTVIVLSLCHVCPGVESTTRS